MSSTIRDRGPALAVLALITFSVLAGCVGSGELNSYDEGPRDRLIFHAAVDGQQPTLDPSRGASDGDALAIGSPGESAASWADEAASNYADVDRTQDVAAVTFVSAPLPETVHLNASTFTEVNLWWTTTARVDYTPAVRIEVTADGEFMAGVERSIHSGVFLDADEWRQETFEMMSERKVLENGTQIGLRIAFIGGATDFQLGVGGEHQTNLSIPIEPDWSPVRYVNSTSGDITYIQDPSGRDQSAGSPVDLPGLDAPAASASAPTATDRIRPDDERATSQAATTTAAAHAGAQGLTLGLLAGGAVALLIGLGVVLRRRPPGGALLGLLVVVLMVAPALSGCIGGSSDAQDAADDLGGTFDDPGEERRRQLEEKGAGDLYGTVYDEVGIPVGGAHVALIGTDNFTTTDGEGKFRFLGLEPGTHEVRVDAEGYRSKEQQVLIREGNITRVDIVVSVSASGAGFKAHRHDMWDGEERITIFDGTVGPGTDPGKLGANSVCTHSIHTCGVAAFPPDPGQLVLPGTRHLEVSISWSDDQVDRAGIAVAPANTGEYYVFSRKASGSTWTIPANPAMTDNGHQSFSLWRFNVYVGSTDNLYNPYDTPNVKTQAFDVTVEIVKGNIPLEPPHRDFWEGETSKVVMDGAEDDDNCAGTSLYGPKELPHPDCYWTPGDGSLVPPGTERLEIEMTWDPNQYPHRSWSLALHPANMHPFGYGMSDLRPVDGSSCGDACVAFEVPLEPEETDAYYQLTSNWVFFLDDGDDPDSPTGHSQTDVPYADPNNPDNYELFGDETHRLTVVAHRETG